MRKYRVKPYKVPGWMVPAIEILRPRERVSTSAWAEQNRILPNGNAIPGPWRNNVTPYLVEIMDAFSDETTEKIVFVKPTQVGGTSAMENALGSLIDQDPAPGPGADHVRVPFGRTGGAHGGGETGTDDPTV